DMFDADTPRPPSRITVGIRGTVATLQADLMWALPRWPVDEEFRIERHAAAGLDVEFHHPAVDTLGVELRIDGAVERICEIDALFLAADVHTLRRHHDTALL